MITQTKPGVVGDLVNGYWQVRFGLALTDVVNLRERDFYNVRPATDVAVTLEYHSSLARGLWKATRVIITEHTDETANLFEEALEHIGEQLNEGSSEESAIEHTSNLYGITQEALRHEVALAKS